MPSPIEELLRQASEKYGVPWQLAQSMAQAESGLNPNAQSKAGAQGIMQLMPATAKELGVTNSFDPAQNIDGGVRYLKQQLDTFKEPSLAVAAYNSGGGNVKKYGGIPPFAETQKYVPRVLDGAKALGFDFGQPKDPADLARQPNAPFQTNNTQSPSPISEMMSQLQTPAQPQAQGQNSIVDLMQQLGLDPSSQKRDRIANIFDAATSGAASVVGSFNRNNGATLQKQYADQYADRSKTRAATKQSSIEQLMKLQEKQGPNLTDDIKEFQYAKQNGYDKSFTDWMAAKATANNPFYQQMQQQSANLNQDQFKFKQKQEAFDQKIAQAKADAEAKNAATPKPLSGESAKVFETANGGVRNIDALKAKIEGGANLIAPSIFDRDTNSIIDDLVDQIGRTRSGGAISKDEEGRFLGLVPSALDSQEVKMAKLARMRVMFSNIASSMGGPQQPGQAPGQAGPQAPAQPGAQPQAQPQQPATQLAPEDQQAISWAQSNPNDPRAAKILQMHGAK